MKIEDMFSSFKNSKGKTIGEIFLYGPIARGGFWESDENSCKNFLDQIKELEKTCSEIHVRINSEGGEVFEGQAICNTLKRCSIPTVAFIDGLAASIATVIASGCDKVICASNGLYMVHSPLCSVSGNAHDMTEMAKLLNKIEEAILETYIEKCGDKCSREEIKELLAGENNDGQGTWMTSKEAKKYGFVDEIGQELAMVAQIDDASNATINGIKMDLSGYQNLDKVREMFENKNCCKDNMDIKNDIEETNMSEEQKISSTIIDQIASAIKNVIGIKNEVEPEVEQPQEEVEATEVSEAPQEVQDVEVQDEPEAQEEPVAEGEVQEEQEPEVDSVEEAEPQQEEPVEELEQIEPEVEPEIEPSVEVQDSIVPEVEASVDLATQVRALTKQLQEIKDADAEKAIKLAKAELSKEVEAKFKGVPGKLEDKVDKIYSIKNSNLEESEKEFILNGFSLLSDLNLEACEEQGTNDITEEYLDDKERKIAEAKALAEKEGISEGKALHVLDKTMTLEQAKKSKK